MTRILTAVLIAFCIFVAYSWYSTRNTDGFDINSQTYEPADVYLPPSQPSNVITPGGPSAPNQLSPKHEVVVIPEEKPFDPQSENYESADMPETLRHPERAFGPGMVNDETSQAVESGTASFAHMATTKAYQTFGPEFAQNGGSFMGEVIANDSSVELSYSSV